MKIKIKKLEKMKKVKLLEGSKRTKKTGVRRSTHVVLLTREWLIASSNQSLGIDE